MWYCPLLSWTSFKMSTKSKVSTMLGCSCTEWVDERASRNDGVGPTSPRCHNDIVVVLIFHVIIGRFRHFRNVIKLKIFIAVKYPSR